MDMSQRLKDAPARSAGQCGGSEWSTADWKHFSPRLRESRRQAQHAKWKRQDVYTIHDPQAKAAPDLTRPLDAGLAPTMESTNALRAAWVNANRHLKRKRSRGAAADPRAICHHRNAVVTMATKYSSCDTNLIAQSFVRYATPCDFFIPIVNRGFTRHGVLMHRHVQPRDGDVLLARTRLAPGATDREITPEVSRIVALQEWARESADDFHYVIHTDARDATIMGNVFAPLYDLGVRGLFATREVFSLEEQYLNRHWVEAATAGTFTIGPGTTVSNPLEWILKLQFGKDSLPPPVMCSGLYGGTGAAFRTFIDGFAEVTKNPPRVQGVDQGYFNLMFYLSLPESGFPFPIHVLDEGIGPYRHMYRDQGMMSWSPDGRLLNCDGVPYALVHQLDRLKDEWAVALRPYRKLISSLAGDVCPS
jgi:hypothetical protein